jgi:hypothetical protein
MMCEEVPNGKLYSWAFGGSLAKLVEVDPSTGKILKTFSTEQRYWTPWAAALDSKTKTVYGVFADLQQEINWVVVNLETGTHSSAVVNWGRPVSMLLVDRNSELSQFPRISPDVN